MSVGVKLGVRECVLEAMHLQRELNLRGEETVGNNDEVVCNSYSIPE